MLHSCLRGDDLRVLILGHPGFVEAIEEVVSVVRIGDRKMFPDEADRDTEAKPAQIVERTSGLILVSQMAKGRDEVTVNGPVDVGMAKARSRPFHRLLMLSQENECPCHPRMYGSDHWIARAQPDRLLDMGDCLLRLARVGQRAPEQSTGLGEARVKLDGVLAFRYGLMVLPIDVVDLSEGRVR